ncbi:MAG TPA: hypothetical protein PK402_08700 [Tepidisphaeraceae bacterium]|nr:hypothetical protein [Tepidisphaeraceae bacterium]
MDIYWSPWYRPNESPEREFHCVEPDLLVRELMKTRNDSNTNMNFLDCPAFLRSMSNLYVWRSPLDVHARLENGKFVAADSASAGFVDLLAQMPGSRTIRNQFKFYVDAIFFAPEAVMMSSYPAFFHSSQLQTRAQYIPGGFDIAKWFRPVEGQFELMENTTEIQWKRGDPMFYFKFETTSPIRLKRFKVTPEIFATSMGCIRYKKWRPNASLGKVYDAFCQSKTDEALLEMVKAASV